MSSPISQQPPPAPQSLKRWQKVLNPAALPADRTVKTAACQKLLSPSGNAINVADIVMQDPALAMRLVSTANRILMQSGNEVKSLSHAISLLGFPQTEQLLRQAPDYELTQRSQLQGYRQQLSISLHAAYQLQEWGQHNSAWSVDGIFLATLLQRTVYWALWSQAPQHMQALENARINRHGSNHSQIEKRILGCTVQALAASLSRRWHLPKLTQASWLPSERGDFRQWVLLSRIIPEHAHQAMMKFPQLNRLCSAPGLAVALANQLADEADWDWYSRRTLRLQRLLATCLNTPLSTAVSITHRQAIITSRKSPFKDTLSPASQLLSFYQRAISIGQPQPAATDATADVAAENTTEMAKKVAHGDTQATTAHADDNLLQGATPRFIALTKQLRNEPAAFGSLHDVFNLAVRTACDELGFERASASLLHTKSKEIRTYYSYNCDDSVLLKSFRHPLQRGDLFNKLLQKPLSVHLNPDNYSHIWPLLPGNFKQACGADQCVMMSVFAHKKPIGIIYADQGISNNAISSQQYALFKQLCLATSIWLSQNSG